MIVYSPPSGKPNRTVQTVVRAVTGWHVLIQECGHIFTCRTKLLVGQGTKCPRCSPEAFKEPEEIRA